MIYKLPPPKTDVAETLKTMLGKADQLQSVMILAIRFDGGQEMACSSMNALELSFLVALANAHMNHWFEFSQEPL